MVESWNDAAEACDSAADQMNTAAQKYDEAAKAARARADLCYGASAMYTLMGGVNLDTGAALTVAEQQSLLNQVDSYLSSASTAYIAMGGDYVAIGQSIELLRQNIQANVTIQTGSYYDYNTDDYVTYQYLDTTNLADLTDTLNIVTMYLHGYNDDYTMSPTKDDNGNVTSFTALRLGSTTTDSDNNTTYNWSGYRLNGTALDDNIVYQDTQNEWGVSIETYFKAPQEIGGDTVSIQTSVMTYENERDEDTLLYTTTTTRVEGAEQDNCGGLLTVEETPQITVDFASDAGYRAYYQDQGLTDAQIQANIDSNPNSYMNDLTVQEYDVDIGGLVGDVLDFTFETLTFGAYNFEEVAEVFGLDDTELFGYMTKAFTTVLKIVGACFGWTGVGIALVLIACAIDAAVQYAMTGDAGAAIAGFVRDAVVSLATLYISSPTSQNGLGFNYSSWTSAGNSWYSYVLLATVVFGTVTLIANAAMQWIMEGELSSDALGQIAAQAYMNAFIGACMTVIGDKLFGSTDPNKDLIMKDTWLGKMNVTNLAGDIVSGILGSGELFVDFLFTSDWFNDFWYDMGIYEKDANGDYKVKEDKQRTVAILKGAFSATFSTLGSSFFNRDNSFAWNDNLGVVLGSLTQSILMGGLGALDTSIKYDYWENAKEDLTEAGINEDVMDKMYTDLASIFTSPAGAGIAQTLGNWANYTYQAATDDSWRYDAAGNRHDEISVWDMRNGRYVDVVEETTNKVGTFTEVMVYQIGKTATSAYFLRQTNDKGQTRLLSLSAENYQILKGVGDGDYTFYAAATTNEQKAANDVVNWLNGDMGKPDLHHGKERGREPVLALFPRSDEGDHGPCCGEQQSCDDRRCAEIRGSAPGGDPG
jgi:hypothetical protein